MAWTSALIPGFLRPSTTATLPTPKPEDSIVKRALVEPQTRAVPALTQVAKALPQNDPMKARVQEVINKTPLVKASPSEQAPSVPKERYDLEQRFIAPNDFIDILKEKGSTITSLEITIPNDDLLAAIATCCPQLTRLSYNPGFTSSGNNVVTAAGLMNIASLSKLTSFRFCAFNMTDIAGGFFDLLSSDLFVNNLQHLYVSLFLIDFFTDSLYKVVAGYKKLETLYVHGEVQHAATLENNPLPPTLKSFQFYQYHFKGLFTDTFLSTLPKGLEKFAASGSWVSVTPAGLQQMMTNLTNLTSINLDGDAITPAQAASLVSEKITSLSISNCNQLQTADYVGLVNNLPNLTTLSWLQAKNFNDQVPLPTNLKSFSIDSPTATFTAVPNGLEELTIMGNRYIYTVYSELNRLKSLHTLRVIRCRGFNDGALIPLLESNKKQLRFIELNEVSVTLEGTKKLGECPELRTLILNYLTPFTADMLSILLNNVNLQNRIQNLYIGDLELNLTNIGEILSKYTHLSLLFLMLMELQVPNNLKLSDKTIRSYWLGASQYRQFIQLTK